KRLYFSIILGIAPVFGLSPVLGAQETSAEHNHADGTPCTADHGHDEHQHKEGETCTEGHDHKEHTHPDGTVCTGDHDHEGHQHAEGKACTDDHDHDKPSAGGAGALEDMIPLHVDEKARHSLDMRFEKVTAVPHGAERTLHGQMVIPPHAVNTYALPAAGRVTFHVKSAQQVRKGQLLYTLASPDIVEMEGAAAQAKAELNRCIADLAALKERRQTLEKIGTKNSELNTTIRFKETEEESLKAALNASENKLKLATASGELKDNLLYVYAAADGSVQSVDMTQGAWGEQGAPALVMTNKGDLEFATTIYGTDPVHYAKAQLALTRGKNTELLDGSLRVADQVDPATQSRALYFTPDRLPEGTHAGQLARLDLYSRDSATDGFIPVPNSAVVKVGVNDVVFIKTGEDAFVMKKVQTLPARQGKTPVKGLIPGQTIVTKGGYELKYILPAEGSGSKKAAGHFHADGQFHEGEH
ncbi:efflux RND transporter periplasmic adaptor subunit, partial [Akkermansia sp.]